MDSGELSRAHQRFAELLADARDGTLSILVLVDMLRLLIASQNYDVAAFIYREWHANFPRDLRITELEHDSVSQLVEDLKKYHPRLPDLPVPTRWMRAKIETVVEYPDIIDPAFINIFAKARKHSISMIHGPEIAWSLYSAIEYIVRNRISGDVVECGVWNGGSALLMALALVHFGDTSRKIYLYDTFDGMPRPQEVDRDWQGVPALGAWLVNREEKPGAPNWGFGGTMDAVKEVVCLSGYPPSNLVFVSGLVEETLPQVRPESIALLHLDTDFFSSTYSELVHLYPALVQGGVLNVDDYGAYQGSRRAVHKYFDENNIPLFLARIDRSSRLAIKVSL